MKIREGVYIEVIGSKDLIVRFIGEYARLRLPMPIRQLGGGPIGDGDWETAEQRSSAVWSVKDAPVIREWLKREQEKRK